MQFAGCPCPGDASSHRAMHRLQPSWPPTDRALLEKNAAANHVEAEVVWAIKTYDGLVEAVLRDVQVIISDAGPLRMGNP